MNRVRDKDVQEVESPAVEPPAPEPEPVGRVEVDARGRNVWRWARDVVDSTSVLLKRLENKDLALEPTQKVPIVRADSAPKGSAAKGSPQKGAPPKGAPAKSAAPSSHKSAKPDASKNGVQHPALQREREPSRGAGGGFDPYNSR
jgi:hypothetical protein